MGRGRELDLLRTVLSAPPSLTIIEGEAGIGKSRLVRELAGDPALVSARVLVGQCEQLHEPFPLGPVLDVFQQVAPALRPEALGPVVGALVPLVPEIAHLLPPPLVAPAQEPGAARHQVFRAASALLEHLSPLVLVLEDAHWADSGTFDLLTFLAFHQPPEVAVLLTTRTGSGSLPVTEAFARAPAGPATVLTLAPLEPDEVREFSRTVFGVDLPVRVTDELHEKTAGIPFVLEEVLRTLLSRLPEGEVPDSPDLLDGLAVPTALRDAMLPRLASLDPVALEIVGVASVLTPQVDVDLLASITERPTREVVAAIARALAVGLLQDEGDLPQFRHVLAQQVVYESLPGTTRRWLHERAAAVISALPGTPPSARLAFHSRRAGDTDAFVRYAEQAADLAVSRGDDSAAARFLLDVVESTDVSLGTRLRLAARLGRVAIDGLAHTEAVPILTRLLDGRSLDPVVRGELRFALGRMQRQQGRAQAGFEQIQRALPDLQERPALAARALAVLAAPETAVEAHVLEHTAWLEEAQRTAQTSQDPAVARAVQIAEASLLLEQGDPAAWVVMDEVREDPALIGDLREHARACLNWAQGALHVGHVHRADSLLAEAKVVAARADYLRVTGVIDLVTLATDHASGRWDTLAERVDAFLDQPAEFGGAVLDARLLHASLLASTGSTSEGVRALSDLVNDAEEVGAVWPLVAARTTLARLLVTSGEPEVSLAQAHLALDIVRGKGLWAWAGEPVQCIVEAQLALGDRQASSVCERRASLGSLVDELACHIAGADAPRAQGSLLSCQALLASASQQPGRVVDLLSKALSTLERSGLRLAEGRAAEHLGAVLCNRGEERGPALLERALGIFGDIGARRDVSRVSRTMRQQGVPIPHPWRGGRRPLGDELSEREREVADLAATGLTNKEIATELFLSLRTVESHMSKALRKLGHQSRRELSKGLT